MTVLLSGDEDAIRAELARLDRPHLEAERASLVRLVEDPSVALAERLRAGLALALAGDPRVTDEPSVITVPPGPAVIGTPPEEVEALVARYPGSRRLWFAKETPRHEAHVMVFALARYPVTNAEYARFARETAHPAPRWWGGAEPPPRLGNHPVHDVSWADAVNYCRWLTRRTGRIYRLADEREWEKAARAGDAREFPWGDDFDPSRANTREAGIGETTPIGCFGPNPLSFFDLAGNVEEWTNSWFRLYEGAAADPEDYKRETRVTRGGSFDLSAHAARCALRHGPYRGHVGIGFRVVRSLTGR